MIELNVFVSNQTEHARGGCREGRRQSVHIRLVSPRRELERRRHRHTVHSAASHRAQRLLHLICRSDETTAGDQEVHGHRGRLRASHQDRVRRHRARHALRSPLLLDHSRRSRLARRLHSQKSRPEMCAQSER